MRKAASRTDYNPTEDDNVTVQGVSGRQGRHWATSGSPTIEENADKVKGVEVDGGDGCVAAVGRRPSQDGTYKPLSRPLFIYPSERPCRSRRWWSSSSSTSTTTRRSSRQAKFVPMTAEQATDGAEDAGTPSWSG